MRLLHRACRRRRRVRLPYFAVRIDGKEVSTVEHLDAGGVLSNVQQAFIETGAFQCGFCTPVQTLQRTGSAALNLAYVACGRIDAFWSSSLKPWDVAAGSLLVSEAGGLITRMNGEPFDFLLPDLLATNSPPLGRELQDLLTPVTD